MRSAQQGENMMNPKPKGDLVERLRDIKKYRYRMCARVIVAIYDDGAVADWSGEISAEDIRHALVSEANNIKRYIEQECKVSA
jgi:hypothetical protein